MIINNEQINYVLSGNDNAKYFWVFESIIEYAVLYEWLRIGKERIMDIQHEVIKHLNSFKPLDEYFFDKLFSNWKKIESSCKAELVVGCPEMYDMMVRDNIIIIDIQNLDKYLSNGYSTSELLPLLITHEFVHMCINQDYLSDENANYIDQLENVLFQEGFAHAIPYIKSYESSNKDELRQYFKKSCEQLSSALKEENPNKQKQLLIDADTGEYWDKFGAISSKLYILSNLDDIVEIYNEEPKNFIKRL